MLSYIWECAGLQSLPFVSVIIVNFNNKILLNNCLLSVFKSDYPSFEVVLVDNASSDNSVDFVRSHFSNTNLVLIQNKVNLGFAGGNNVGIGSSRGEYLFFLNNDTEVDENWLKQSIKLMSSDPCIGACQCKLLRLKERKKFDGAGGYVDRFISPIIKGTQEYDYGQYDQNYEIFWAKGAAFAVKKKVLDEVGYFDNDYFLEYEETDLCWRIWLCGYRILFAPRSIVYHAGSASISRKKLKVYYYFHRNHIATILKNYELKNIVRYLPVLIVLKILRDFQSIKAEKLIRLKAIFSTFKNFRKIWIKRQQVQIRIRKVTDEAIFRRNIILSFKHLNENLGQERNGSPPMDN